jgi:hypothetical protein
MVWGPIKGRNEEKVSSQFLYRCELFLYTCKSKFRHFLLHAMNIGHCDEAAAGPRDGELTITPDTMQTEPRTATDQCLPDRVLHVSSST